MTNQRVWETLRTTLGTMAEELDAQSDVAHDLRRRLSVQMDTAGAAQCVAHIEGLQYAKGLLLRFVREFEGFEQHHAQTYGGLRPGAAAAWFAAFGKLVQEMMSIEERPDFLQAGTRFIN